MVQIKSSARESNWSCSGRGRRRLFRFLGMAILCFGMAWSLMYRPEVVAISSSLLLVSTQEESPKTSRTETTTSISKPQGRHQIAGLSCAKFGGPPDDVSAEMVYWRDIPSDASYVSPFRNVGPKVKYLTFEPDQGGWNNIRMSMETAVAMAYVMGRTLVMPPRQGMYLLHKTENNQNNKHSFYDFFHFDSLEAEHAGIEIISFEEFLKREATTGHLIDKYTGKVSFPPNNVTDWNGVDRFRRRILDHWTRNVTTTPGWSFDKCVVAFPAKAGTEGVQRIYRTLDQALQVQLNQVEHQTKYMGKPTPVDAPAVERLQEMRVTRSDRCVYNREMQESKVVHQMGDNDSGARLLVHFYVFLFFENWRQDLWTKRFVRDHLRYSDELQCAAATVVGAMRQLARQHGDASGTYDSFHIRRGDFQYKDTRVEPEVIFENSHDVLVENSTIYIATDERNKTFFDIFRKHYNVYFLDDFQHLLSGVNTNYYGMLDQLIASRGRTFVGCFYSTFTGYINRIRGYHSQKDKAPGYENGEINSYYYIPKMNKYALRQYRSISGPYWAREFPVAWRDIDKGVGEPLDMF